MTFTAILNL